MRVAFCGGGTGGHVYPALAVASALAEAVADGNLELLYMGTAAGPEASLVGRTSIPFHSIRAAAVRGRSPWAAAAAALDIAVGVVQARRVMARFHPQAVLITGGYVGVPVAVASRLGGTPLVVYLPDVQPGWAVQYAAQLAQRVATTTDRALPYLPAAKTAVTGYPVRPAFWEATRGEARRRLGLCPEEPLLLVSGGSHGARRLNQVVAVSLPSLLAVCNVVHICGHDDEPWLATIRRDLPDDLQPRYRLYPYLHDEMPWTMAAADLAVLRSGASVMGELPALGLPAILVPYPHAGGHQMYNAQYMAEAGAALVLEESHLEEMPGLALELLQDGARRQAMAAAVRSLAQPTAAHDIARLLLEVAT
ncbi:MAG: glycosyltransferase [Dehalococcoidia bacterium]